MAELRRQRLGFTLVELLVVIAIIGGMIALLMSAVNYAREAGRRAVCTNNLRDLGVAANAHLAKIGYYPSGGWGSSWIGDPDWGYGARQPGGWLYNCLPFLGLDNTHDIGKGLADAAKKTALKGQAAAVVPTFICPSRRRVLNYPGGRTFVNSEAPPSYAKTDYAGNGGSERGRLPAGPAIGCMNHYPDCARDIGDRYNWEPDWANPPINTIPLNNGVIARRLEVGQSRIIDGISNTILAAEKSMAPANYNNGADSGDQGTCYQGYDRTVCRWVPRAKAADFDATCQPYADKFVDEKSPPERFGAAHPNTFQAVFCDGGVRSIQYAIDPRVFGALGVRNDETGIDIGSLEP